MRRTKCRGESQTWILLAVQLTAYGCGAGDSAPAESAARDPAAPVDACLDATFRSESTDGGRSLSAQAEDASRGASDCGEAGTSDADSLTPREESRLGAADGNVPKADSSLPSLLPADSGAPDVLAADSSLEARDAESVLDTGLSDRRTTVDAPADVLPDQRVISEAGPCGAGAIALCNDGNECTLDRLDDTCACVHEPAADGKACDDGNLCTEGDLCTGGVCKGTASSSQPEILGTATNLSDTIGIGTVVGFATENRAVFATANQLRLVGMDGDKLTLLDQRTSAIQVRPRQVSPQVWVLRPAFFLVSLGQGKVAVVGSTQGIDLYDVSGDSFNPLGRWGFASGYSLAGATGRGNRIWICGGSGVQRFSVDASNQLSPGPRLDLPTNPNHQCQGLALSADGNTLFVATSNGLDLVDVTSSDGTMSRTGTALDGHFLLDVSANAEYLGLYDLKESMSGQGDVLVLPVEGGSPVASFPMSAQGPSPAGVALVDDGLVLQKTDQSTWSSEFYGLSPSGATLLHSWTMSTVPPGTRAQTPFHIVSSSHHAVLEPFHQIVRISNDGNFVSVAGPVQGSFERVRASGPNTVEVHGPRSMGLVDISDPTHPALTVGGLVLPSDEQPLKIELSSNSPFDLGVLPLTTNAGNPTGATASLLLSQAGQLPTAEGTITTDGTPGFWASAGGYLAEVIPEGSSDFRIRRFRADAMTHAYGQPITPELEQIVSISVPDEANERVATWFGMDARTGRIAIVETRGFDAPDGSRISQASYLAVFELQRTGYVPVFAWPATADKPLGVAVAADRTLLVAAQRVVLLGPDGATLAELTGDAGQDVATALLGFDEHFAYFSSGGRVSVRRSSDLSPVASYSVPGVVTSLAAVGKYLAFGMQGAVSIASRACSLGE